MRVQVRKNSFTPCTPELEQQQLCQIADNQFSGCFTYENAGSANLACDLRLVSIFAGNKQSSILRKEKIFYNQKQTLCFKYDQKRVDFEKVKSMSVVCQPIQSGANPSDVCDVATSLCENETRKTLTVVP